MMDYERNLMDREIQRELATVGSTAPRQSLTTNGTIFAVIIKARQLGDENRSRR